jgi:hypothetical protein
MWEPFPFQGLARNNTSDAVFDIPGLNKSIVKIENAPASSP